MAAGSIEPQFTDCQKIGQRIESAPMMTRILRGVGARMRNPKLEILKFQPLPEVGAALRDRRKQIIAAWRKKVLEVLPEADELTLAQLKNSLPQLLDQIADALAASDPGPTAELVRSSPDHGHSRFDQNFDLNEL